MAKRPSYSPEVLAWARRRRKWTTAAFAARLEVPEATVIAWELGERQPTPRQVQKIADVSGVDVETLRLPEPPKRGRPIRGDEPRERLTVFVFASTARWLGDGADGRKRAGEILDREARGGK